MAWIVANWTFNGNGCNKATERQKQYKITKNDRKQACVNPMKIKLLEKNHFSVIELFSDKKYSILKNTHMCQKHTRLTL